ncbi:MAG TPA: hypothetical protein PLV56_00820, partial [Synergistales bacterium]|nr:hypothetical protein [Synergistales bacterium]
GFDITDFLDIDGSVYQADLTYNFTPDIAFKGAYYMENLPGDVWNGPLDDSPSAWKAILDISQKAFGFTSVWIEYASFDPEFFLVDFAGCDSDGNGPWDNYGVSITPGLGFTYSWEYPIGVDVLFVKLQQKWNDKWTTFQRFVKADHAFKAGFEEGPGDIDVTNWTLGIKYYYTPNLSFELVYDNVDYGNGWIGNPTFDPIDDSLIRLRTHVAF